MCLRVSWGIWKETDRNNETLFHAPDAAALPKGTEAFRKDCNLGPAPSDQTHPAWPQDTSGGQFLMRERKINSQL